MILITISHIVNVLVAGTVAVLLLRNTPRMSAVYGEVTPARSILASIYLAIAATSVVALAFPQYSIVIATVLFPLQIFYKILTIFTVGNVTHPVVVSNILISALHITSLLILFKYI
jgi:hypothetical protein